MENKKTSFTMAELDEYIQQAIADGRVRKTPKPTEKERKSAHAFVDAVEQKSPEIKDFFDQDPTGCHFCRSVPMPLAEKKRYMNYVYARRVLYADN